MISVWQYTFNRGCSMLSSTVHPFFHHHQTEWLTSFLQCELSCAAWVPFVGETAGHTRHTWMASYPDAASCDLQNLSGTCKHCVMLLYSSHRLIMFHIKTSCGKKYVGYSESKYRLCISLAHLRDCHFAHVQWFPLSIEKLQTPFREIRVMFMFVPVR